MPKVKLERLFDVTPQTTDPNWSNLISANTPNLAHLEREADQLMLAIECTVLESQYLEEMTIGLLKPPHERPKLVFSTMLFARYSHLQPSSKFYFRLAAIKLCQEAAQAMPKQAPRSMKPKHTCAFRNEHDPDTLEPLGPPCGKPATHELFWIDGRVSPACPDHGLEAIDPDARKQIIRVTCPTDELQWWTVG